MRFQKYPDSCERGLRVEEELLLTTSQLCFKMNFYLITYICENTPDSHSRNTRFQFTAPPSQKHLGRETHLPVRTAKDRNNRYSYLLNKEILEILQRRIITGINITLEELECMVCYKIRDSLHGGGGSQVGEVSRLSIKSLIWSPHLTDVNVIKLK